ncbi:MAG: hypothetical protein PHI41_08250 [Erysipelotrichaceae bacterium]|nr:hypothetical protein [Erysipelotrichaceae bacterium]MDD3809818.1 hypothetical protein [Erysipelotrichaceae bacterium]
MSKFTFTKAQINQLKNNEYVESVSSKGITYSLEFKYLAIGVWIRAVRLS